MVLPNYNIILYMHPHVQKHQQGYSFAEYPVTFRAAYAPLSIFNTPLPSPIFHPMNYYCLISSILTVF